MPPALLQGENLPSQDVCVLCGIVLESQQDRRSKTVRTFKAMLQNRWVPTPYAWQTLYTICHSSPSNDHRLTTCTACINWMRRSIPTNTSAHLPVTQKTFLLIARLICFSLAPGEVSTPDTRNMRRLLRVLNSTTKISNTVYTNAYLSLIPPHVKAAFRDFPDDVNLCVQNIILHWHHQVNNSSPIFRNRDTAYLVRKALASIPGPSIQAPDTDAPPKHDPSLELKPNGRGGNHILHP